MAAYPSRGKTPWDEDLKSYIDGAVAAGPLVPGGSDSQTAQNIKNGPLTKAELLASFVGKPPISATAMKLLSAMMGTKGRYSLATPGATVVTVSNANDFSYPNLAAPVQQLTPITTPAVTFRGAHLLKGAPLYSDSWSPDSISPVNGSSFQPYAIPFVSNLRRFEVVFIGGGSVRIIQDGKIAGAVTVPSGGQYYTVRVDALSATPRTWRVEVDGTRFVALVLANGDTFTPPGTPNIRAILVGNSFVEAGQAGSRTNGMAWQIGEMMGWDDTWASGSGGTDYLEPNAGLSRMKYRDRFTHDVSTYNPDVVGFVGAGRNDGLYSPAQVKAEATLLFAKARTECPNAILFATSPFNKNTAEVTSLSGYADAIRDAAATVPGMIFLDILGYLTDANIAAFVSTVDNVHPTQAGQDFWAALVALKLREALARM